MGRAARYFCKHVALPLTDVQAVLRQRDEDTGQPRFPHLYWAQLDGQPAPETTTTPSPRPRFLGADVQVEYEPRAAPTTKDVRPTPAPYPILALAAGATV